MKRLTEDDIAACWRKANEGNPMRTALPPAPVSLTVQVLNLLTLNRARVATLTVVKRRDGSEVLTFETYPEEKT